MGAFNLSLSLHANQGENVITVVGIAGMDRQQAANFTSRNRGITLSPQDSALTSLPKSKVSVSISAAEDIVLGVSTTSLTLLS